MFNQQLVMLSSVELITECPCVFFVSIFKYSQFQRSTDEDTQIECSASPHPKSMIYLSFGWKYPLLRTLTFTLCMRSLSPHPKSMIYLSSVGKCPLLRALTLTLGMFGVSWERGPTQHVYRKPSSKQPDQRQQEIFVLRSILRLQIQYVQFLPFNLSFFQKMIAKLMIGCQVPFIYSKIIQNIKTKNPCQSKSY